MGDSRVNVRFLFIALIVLTAVAGYFFPDMDIRLLGIKNHRYWLFHSALIPFVIFAIVNRVKTGSIIGKSLYGLCIAFTLGVGVHLFQDCFEKKSIVFPIVKSLILNTYLDDILWLIANTIIAFVLAVLLGLKTARKSG